MESTDKIKYGYLNMDKRCFEKSKLDLVNNTGKGAILRAIPNFKHGQVLVASGHKEYTEIEAILLCRKLSGVPRG